MEIKEALKHIKYPEDKLVDKDTTNPEILAFNEGWNELHHQLVMLDNANPPHLEGE